MAFYYKIDNIKSKILKIHKNQNNVNNKILIDFILLKSMSIL